MPNGCLNGSWTNVQAQSWWAEGNQSHSRVGWLVQRIMGRLDPLHVKGPRMLRFAAFPSNRNNPSSADWNMPYFKLKTIYLSDQKKERIWCNKTQGDNAGTQSHLTTLPSSQPSTDNPRFRQEGRGFLAPDELEGNPLRLKSQQLEPSSFSFLSFRVSITFPLKSLLLQDGHTQTKGRKKPNKKIIPTTLISCCFF